MRSLLFVLLVACGASKTTSTTVINQPAQPAAASSQPMVATVTKPTCESAAGDVKCVLDTMQYFGDLMCGCKDKACADKVNDEMTEWGTMMAKNAGNNEKPTEQDMKRSGDIMSKYVECMTKLSNGGAPPDPCAGGADPCGG